MSARDAVRMGDCIADGTAAGPEVDRVGARRDAQGSRHHRGQGPAARPGAAAGGASSTACPRRSSSRAWASRTAGPGSEPTGTGTSTAWPSTEDWVLAVLMRYPQQERSGLRSEGLRQRGHPAGHPGAAGCRAQGAGSSRTGKSSDGRQPSGRPAPADASPVRLIRRRRSILHRVWCWCSLRLAARLAVRVDRRRQVGRRRRRPGTRPPPARRRPQRPPPARRPSPSPRWRRCRSRPRTSTSNIEGWYSWALLDRRTGEIIGSENMGETNTHRLDDQGVDRRRLPAPRGRARARPRATPGSPTSTQDHPGQRQRPRAEQLYTASAGRPRSSG